MSKSSQALTPEQIRAIGRGLDAAARTASERMMALGRAFQEALEIRNPPRKSGRNDE